MKIGLERTLQKIDKELNRPDAGRRAAVFNFHKKLSPEHITRGLIDILWDVRCAAMAHHDFGEQHVKIALRDENKYCRMYAYMKGLDNWPWEVLDDNPRNNAILYYDLLLRLLLGRCESWEFRTDRNF